MGVAIKFFMNKYLKFYTAKKKNRVRFYFTFAVGMGIVDIPFTEIQAQVASFSSPSSQMEVYVTQQLSFGSFSNGTLGGEITISPQGILSVNGSIIIFPDVTPTPAIFEVKSTPNRIVHIILPTHATLTHSKGKANMTVTDFTSDKANNAFVTVRGNPFINPVNVGGKLKVQSSSINPPGKYTGTFSVIFAYE